MRRQQFCFQVVPRAVQAACKVWLLAAPMLGVSVTACDRLPPLSHASNNLPFSAKIPIEEIVQRVKCDLSDALYKKVYYGPDSRKLAWMQNWTAKTDLTLEANETGGVTPNIAYLMPLRNAFFLGAGPSSINTATGAVTNVVGATTQNFTLGVGGTYSGQATRTETMSFTVALAELKKWKENPANAQFCTPQGVTDLEGGLDLKSWLDEALRPAISGNLQTGIHPDPGSAKSSATVAASSPTKITTGLNKQNLPPVTLSPEDKARLDLQLALALTALGVPYNLDQFNALPAKKTDPSFSSFCTAEYSKYDSDDDSKPLVKFTPPAFQVPDATKNLTLEMQAATAAANAYSAANQAAASQILRSGIKKDANDAAQTAATYAIRVKRAAPLAVDFIRQYCRDNGDPYLSPKGGCDLVTPTLTIGGTITKGDTIKVVVKNAKLPGGSELVMVNVSASDTTETIASNLSDAINTDKNLESTGIAATTAHNVVTLSYDPTVSQVQIDASSVRAEGNNGGSETITVALNTSGTYTVIPLSPQFCNAYEYNKFREQFFRKQFDRAQLLVNLAQANATLAKSLVTPDPPIESIGQAMNFVVTVGLSASPNWTYLHWKAPANGSSLASLSGIRTHTLNIALGSPTASGVTEVQRVLDNAATRQAIQGLQQ